MSSVRNTDGSINVDELKDEESKIFVEYLEDRQMLEQYVTDNPNFIEYALENLPKIGWEATPGVLGIFAKRVGTTMKELADYISDGTAKLKKASNDLVDKAGKVLKYGKAVGPAFGAAGMGYGVYDDLANNDKTAGEALAHNGTSLMVGVGTTVGLGLLVSNPVGWAAAGVVAAGAVATVGFEYV